MNSTNTTNANNANILFLLTRVSFNIENDIVSTLLTNIINTDVDSIQMSNFLHHYICQSYYNNDMTSIVILNNEVLSEIAKMGTLNQEMFNTEYMERMCIRSSIEFSLAKKYIYHVYNKGIPDYLRCASYTNMVDVYAINRQVHDCISANKKFLTQYSMEHMDLTMAIKNYSNPPALIMQPIIVSNDSKDILVNDNIVFNLDRYIGNLQDNIKNMNELSDYYTNLKEYKKKLDIATVKLNYLTLIHELYMKMLEFDCERVSQLPPDIVSHISSFLGEELLSEVRKRCISRRLFPNGKDDLRYLLKSWGLKHLKAYASHIYLKYDVRTNDISRGRSYKIYFKKSANKSEFVEYILRGIYKGSFYELHRDVQIITIILRSSRKPRRRNIKNNLTQTNIDIVSDFLEGDLS
jgi:hypothetical protein